MEKSGSKCGCPCHKMAGVFIVLFGLVFLLGALDVLAPKTVSIIWPIFVMLGGLKCMMKGSCKCCDQA